MDGQKARTTGRRPHRQSQRPRPSQRRLGRGTRRKVDD
jgi:hypothetical protein